MKNELAKTRNIRMLSEVHRELTSISARVNERMGLVYGESGLGKSTAVAWLCIQVNGIYVEASPNWTPHSMLKKIGKELGAPTAKATADLEEIIISRLSMAEVPLFVDEADSLTTKSVLMETLRYIHDRAKIPLILIGMEGLDRKLSRYEQLSSRIARKLKFQPCDINDAKALAETCCEVGIDPKLLTSIHTKAKGSLRRILIELEAIEKFTKSQRDSESNPWTSCNKDQWAAYQERRGGK